MEIKKRMNKRGRPNGGAVKKKKVARAGKRKRIWGRGTNSQNRIDGGLTLFSPTLTSGLDENDALQAMYNRRDLVRQRMKQIVVQKKSGTVSLCLYFFKPAKTTKRAKTTNFLQRNHRSKNLLEHLNNFIVNFFLQK